MLDFLTHLMKRHDGLDHDSNVDFVSNRAHNSTRIIVGNKSKGIVCSVASIFNFNYLF